MDVFIDAYQDFDAFPASLAVIADVLGNGQPKLIVYEKGRKTLAFFKGTTREG